MPTVTRGDLKTALKGRLAESDWDYFGETLVNACLNRAHRKVAFDTRYIQTTYEASVTDGTREYALPSRLIGILAVEWEKDKVPVKTPAWLDHEIGNGWRDAEGNEPEYATVENNRLGLYPTPNATAAALTKPLAVRGYYFPSNFTSDSSVIEVPDYLDEAILDWAEYLLWGGYNKDMAKRKQTDYAISIKDYVKEIALAEGPGSEQDNLRGNRRTHHY